MSSNGTGTDLLREVQKILTDVLDSIVSFYKTTLSDGTRNPSMRQTLHKDDVVLSFDELYETASLVDPLFSSASATCKSSSASPSTASVSKRLRRSGFCESERDEDDYADRPDGSRCRSTLLCAARRCPSRRTDVMHIVYYLLDLEAKEAGGEFDLTKSRLKFVNLNNTFAKKTPGGHRDFNKNVVLVNADCRP